MSNNEITKILLRRDTTLNWQNANPILDLGEPALEIGSSGSIVSLKFGDGSHTWQELPSYSSGGGVVENSNVVAGYFNTTDNLFYADSAYEIVLNEEPNKIYIDLNTGYIYKYEQDAYTQLTNGGTDSSVIDGYYSENQEEFYSDFEQTIVIPKAHNRLYIDIPTGNIYRWGGDNEGYGHYVQLTGNGGSGDVDVPRKQVERISFAYNLVINSNGAQFGGTNSGYQWNDLNEWGVYPGYDVKGLCYRDEIVQDEEVFKQYMKFMTGSEYLPEYNRDEPHDTYIYLQSGSYDVNSKVWKLQYSHVEFQGQQFNVLLAFKVTQFPFALKEEIPTIPEFPVTYEGSGNLDTSINRIIYTISSDLLSQAKAITFRLVFRDNNKNEGGILLDGVIINHNDVYFAEEHKQGIAENTSLSYYFDTSLPAYTVNVDFDINEFDINNLEINYWTITLY